MKKLPKSLYAVVKEDSDTTYILSSDNIIDLGVEIGEKVKIGFYKLEGTYDAEGVIETSKLKKA